MFPARRAARRNCGRARYGCHWAHRDIPHSVWIPGAGLGTVPPEIDAQYRNQLAALTGHDFGAAVVV